jgi:hypothetical protein
MKPLKKRLYGVSVEAHVCFGRINDPITRDLLYCALMFLDEVNKSLIGIRPRSSRTMALELAAKRAWRVRLYRKFRRVPIRNSK